MDLLMVACSYGHINIVKYLLDHKPNLLNKNIKGKTALNIATQNGFEAIVSLLN